MNTILGNALGINCCVICYVIETYRMMKPPSVSPAWTRNQYVGKADNTKRRILHHQPSSKQNIKLKKKHKLVIDNNHIISLAEIGEHGNISPEILGSKNRMKFYAFFFYLSQNWCFFDIMFYSPNFDQTNLDTGFYFHNFWQNFYSCLAKSEKFEMLNKKWRKFKLLELF